MFVNSFGIILYYFYIDFITLIYYDINVVGNIDIL
ncbi:MAG: hypothetical protein UT41_C0002G0031 [Candidatus Wolfebacteria bacterium GW2011_GWC2_39_22]|uniref:Uncharacterized protein n=1 Tax=Candidatus Wolfebacteria bacterium GW2011_GWC2_39_22 TaxID=1619013 RepID=A0A0G0RF29_9BACT|nr:MAG: hypothetical protein UT41_C0002G0031 [Candidatus Wolfebacteria bacterium GW2011_GWC2_39_22]